VTSEYIFETCSLERTFLTYLRSIIFF